MTNTELLKTLFEKYGLYYDSDNPNSKENDVFIHKHYKIITRGGIQKIEKAAGIECDFEVVNSGPDYFYIKVTGTMNGRKYVTFASASTETSQNKYYPEMAEKRARSRVILTLAGLYELGVFGEDEADKFSSVVEESKKSNSYTAAKYKGQ